MKLLVFETHPIQYRAPMYQEIERITPGSIEVIYASDFSVRGYVDSGFGATFSWDVPLLSGYPYRILGNEVRGGINNMRGLSGRRVSETIDAIRPAAILLHSLHYEFNWVAYYCACARGIPIWLRTETQDSAFVRGRIKSSLRSLVYRLVYLGIDKAFYIGKLNQQHYLKHGISPDALSPAHYCTPNPLRNVASDVKESIRQRVRSKLGIDRSTVVIAFFVKLIEKKDPGLILEALANMDRGSASLFHCVIVGSGVLEAKLRQQAMDLNERNGISVHFAGFVNQSALPDYYLASDIVVLPSRRMGETWGLVVNEAIQAGCSVVVTDAVGCNADFGDWPRVKTIPVGDQSALLEAIKDLAKVSRSFDWASQYLANYSVEAAALALDHAIKML